MGKPLCGPSQPLDEVWVLRNSPMLPPPPPLTLLPPLPPPPPPLPLPPSLLPLVVLVV